MQFYTVEQAIAARYTLMPIECNHCGHIGEVTYDQHSNDYYCAWCGRWHDEPNITREEVTL